MMTVTINFVDSKVKMYQAKDVSVHTNENGVLCVTILTEAQSLTFYASTILSINYDVQKPHINVTGVFVW